VLTLQAMLTVVEKLKNAGWGPVRLSDALGIKPQAISQWKQVPADRVLQVEALTGLSRHELRPDVFGPKKAAEHAA